MLSDRAIRRSIERFRLASPARLDVVLDASLSMTSGDGSKEEVARGLGVVLLALGEAAGGHGTLHLVRGPGRDRVFDAADLSRIARVPFDGCQPLPQRLAAAPDAAIRVVISDFLWPGDPAPLVRSAAEGAARLWLVQVLDEWELHPEPGGPTRLIDVETDEIVDRTLDRAAIDEYHGRLNRLREALEHACRAAGASLTTTSAAVGLERLCADGLVPAGLLGVRDRATGEG